MTITATIVADSISPVDTRLTTFQLRYPRFIHAELMTHRVFSRNASSSRAIPVKKMIEDLRRDPAMPVYWGTNKPGMQAGEELSSLQLSSTKNQWLLAMEKSINHAETMVKLGLHKQIANRILEPWAHINVVVTATDYANFFELRCHADAQPEIKALADVMYDAQQESQPNKLEPGQWHLPYITENDRDVACFDHGCGPNGTPEHIALLQKVSVARCARVSYLTHDGRQTTVEEDVALYERLVVSQPLHASPAEHQATPDVLLDVMGRPQWQNRYEWGNFRHWRQLRKQLPGEFTPG